jgi:ABC-type lipoprotein release transport system permease subunit
MAEGRIFGAFERAVALRYLWSRKGERFVSVIAGFSVVGIALGIATLIVVLSVMGGFRQELLGRILGLNGHLGVTGDTGYLLDYQDAAAKLRALPMVAQATAWPTARAPPTTPATPASTRATRTGVAATTADANSGKRSTSDRLSTSTSFMISPATRATHRHDRCRAVDGPRPRPQPD